MNQYRTQHFKLQELVPKKMFDAHGSALWELFDDRALKTLDALRKRFGVMTINNWLWGGNYHQRGLRDVDHYGSAEKYAHSRSQHKYGRAFDVTFKEHTSKEVRDYIIAHPDEFPYITFLEVDISWFHFDVRQRDGLALWSPTRGFVNAE